MAKVTKPSTAAIIRGQVDKTCGPLQRYARRTLELHPSGLYVYLDGMPDPKSIIQVTGCTLTNNTDSPNGFAIYPSNGGKKVKFICESLDTKKRWLKALHDATTASGGVDAAGDAAGDNPASEMLRRQRGELVRQGAPLKEGNLMKRRGVGSSYNVRWFEVWAGQGIAYAKYKSAADAAFKVVPISGSTISMNISKLRICIDPPVAEEPPLYIRCESMEELESWMFVLDRERGSTSAWIDVPKDGADFLSPTDTAPAGSPGRVIEDDEDGDESDIEAEITDLASEVPISHTSIPCVCEELSSVNRTLRCDKDTPGFDKVLEERLMLVGDYGFTALLKQFEERMTVPMYGPFKALDRHINNLDLDAKAIRHEVVRLLEDHPRELRIAIVLKEADQLLTACAHAREVYSMRRDIAQFREQKDANGLRLGVNGSIEFIDSMAKQQDPMKAHGHDIAKVEKLLVQFETAIQQFRLEFDFFDDAYFTIEDMTRAADKAHKWLEQALNRDPHDDDDI